MAYKLDKPYTKEEKREFIDTYNREHHLAVYGSDKAIYALEVNELWDEEKQEPYVDPDYEEKQRKAKEDHINSLIMTALDFIGVLEDFGLDYITQIKPFLEAAPDLDKQLKYCQNVWCGVAKQVFKEPITIGEITITAEMIEAAFKAKHGEE